MPSMNSTTEDPEQVLPFLHSVVLRIAWSHRAQRSVFPDACARDLLHGRPLPAPGNSLTVEHLTLDLSLEVIRRTPNKDEHIVSTNTRINIIPALPPSLAHSNTAAPVQLTRFIDAALNALPLAPMHALLLAPHGSERHAAAAVCASAIRRNVPVLRYTPPDLSAAYGSRGVQKALQTVLTAAQNATPAILLLDNIHLLASPTLQANAHALTLFLRISCTPNLPIILLASPDEQSLHPLIHSELYATIAYKTPILPALANLNLNAPNWAKISKEVGASQPAKLALEHALSWRITRAATFTALSVSPPRAVLLYGAPGTGKTLIARISAQAAHFSLHVLNASRLARGEVGASERALRVAYDNACDRAPAVLFIDEIEALFSSPDSSGARLVAALTTCMDHHNDVVVVAATNRPWRVAPALLRAGRFDTVVHTALPDKMGRVHIAEVYAAKMNINSAPAHALRRQAEMADGFSGADIAGACRRAAMEAVAGEGEIEVAHIVQAFRDARPSVSKEAAKEIADWKPRGNR